MQHQLARLLQEIRSNPRLQMALAAIITIAASSSVLSMMDARQTLEQQVLKGAERNTALLRKLNGPNNQASLQASIERNTQQIDAALWQAPSPAILQTSYSSWLAGELADAGIANVQPSQPVLQSTDEASDQQNLACSSAPCPLLEVRSTIRAPFTPASIGKIFQLTEGGERITRIEQLSLNTTTKQLEIALLSLGRIAPDASEPAEASTSSIQPAPIAQTGSASAPETQQPAKIVEIKW
ncbi:hypothetical protein [Chitinilyticum aquatile]|uniref:hypothetical protein n=1 Tax=Chitinilyticum aquatile TaxID=362520 RepID=UPI00042037D0|nr:hypothetical protein [Chitinilyticum aquatile]